MKTKRQNNAENHCDNKRGGHYCDKITKWFGRIPLRGGVGQERVRVNRAKSVERSLGFSGTFSTVWMHRLIPARANEKQLRRAAKSCIGPYFSDGAGTKIFWPIFSLFQFTFGLASITCFCVMVFIPLALKAAL